MMLKGKILKSLLIAALTCFSWQTSMGQKTFTLEDLNYGGTNFYNMRVQTRYTNWWGDELIKGDVEACYLVNKQTGKDIDLDLIEFQAERMTRDEVKGAVQTIQFQENTFSSSNG